MLPLLLAVLAADPEPMPKVKEIAKGANVFLESVGGKPAFVTVKSAVVLREGTLEGILTRKQKKEHEYILAGDFDARHLHAALLLLGAKNGAPVEFVPKFKPASGSTLKVQYRYKKGGKTVLVDAGAWVKPPKGGKRLDGNFVFGGSKFVDDPDGKGGKYYVANFGDVVCLCNMDSAMMDLPYASPKAMNGRIHEADTAAIPPVGTEVDVVFTLVKK